MSKSFKKFPAESADTLSKTKKIFTRAVRRVNKVKIHLEEEPLFPEEIVPSEEIRDLQHKPFDAYVSESYQRKFRKSVDKLLRK